MKKVFFRRKVKAMNRNRKQTILLTTLLIASLAIIIFITRGILQNGSFQLDAALSKYFTRTITDDWLHIMEALALSASKPAIISISLLVIGILWIKKRDYAGMIAVFVFVMGGNIVNKLIKSWTQRERPTGNMLEDGFSFPSGHVMVGFIMYGLIVYFIYHYTSNAIIKNTSFLIVSLLLICIGVSRVAAGEHYATDVIAGYAFGGFFLVIAIKVYQLMTQERNAIQQVHRDV